MWWGEGGGGRGDTWRRLKSSLHWMYTKHFRCKCRDQLLLLSQKLFNPIDVNLNVKNNRSCVLCCVCERLDLEASRLELSAILLGVLEANEEKLRMKLGDFESSDAILERVICGHAEFGTMNAMLEHTLQEHVDAIEKLKETSENERSEFARMKEELSEELKVSNTLSAQMEEEKNEWIQRI